jgi:hypothetical protein
MTQMLRDFALRMDRGRAAVIDVLNRGDVTPQDVAQLRREIFHDGAVSREEADALFQVECSIAPTCAEWTAFFVEAITDHIVWQARPTGIVNEAQGEWLLARCDGAASLNGLAVLVNVMAEAHRVPLWFLAAVRARAARGWTGVEAARNAA